MPRLVKGVAALCLLGAVALGPPPDANPAVIAEAPRCVALTFDDGPDPLLTPQLLSVLEREHVPATFFVVGRRVAENPAIVARESADGNEIGNHSWDHRMLARLSEPDIVAEIDRTDHAVLAATGQKPDLIRPPYGLIAPSVEAILRRHGLMRPIALWDTDSLDWLTGSRVLTTIRASLTPSGSIVLMHDIHAPTVASVPGLIQGLRRRGLRFTTVSGLAGCGVRDPPGLAMAASDATLVARDTPPVWSTGRLLATLIGWMR